MFDYDCMLLTQTFYLWMRVNDHSILSHLFIMALFRIHHFSKQLYENYNFIQYKTKTFSYFRVNFPIRRGIICRAWESPKCHFFVCNVNMLVQTMQILLVHTSTMCIITLFCDFAYCLFFSRWFHMEMMVLHDWVNLTLFTWICLPSGYRGGLQSVQKTNENCGLWDEAGATGRQIHPLWFSCWYRSHIFFPSGNVLFSLIRLFSGDKHITPGKWIWLWQLQIIHANVWHHQSMENSGLV